MVAKEHAEHESIIEMYRNGGGGGSVVVAAPATTTPQRDRRSRLDGTTSKRRGGKGDEKDDPTAATAKNRGKGGASPAKKMGRAVRKIGRRFSLGGGAYKG